MVKFNLNMRRQNQNRTASSLILAVLSIYLIINKNIDRVEARKEGDDIIMTKGKLIMRGGKGKGHLILDTGKSGDHEDSHHMIPMMAHHFNPYSFYPMQHQQSPTPMIHVHPVYIEDHSAMHQHQPESSHHHEYQHHHHEEQQHYPMEYHGLEYQHHHHEPQHHEMQHHPEEHHEEQQYHHEPMKQHYEQEAHHEEESQEPRNGLVGGYEGNPMMQMMMHGSGPQPTYDQLAALQAFHQQALYANQHNFPNQALQQHQQQMMQNFQDQQKEQQAQLQQENKPVQAQPSQETQQNQQQSIKPTSLFDQAGNNPLAAIIKPIFKRDPNKQKKP